MMKRSIQYSLIVLAYILPKPFYIFAATTAKQTNNVKQYWQYINLTDSTIMKAVGNFTE